VKESEHIKDTSSKENIYKEIFSLYYKSKKENSIISENSSKNIHLHKETKIKKERLTNILLKTYKNKIFKKNSCEFFFKIKGKLNTIPII